MFGLKLIKCDAPERNLGVERQKSLEITVERFASITFFFRKKKMFSVAPRTEHHNFTID
jgi:hypothetical protein